MDHYPILVYLCRNEEKCRLVTEVGKVLTTAVSSLAKCEGIITDANQHFCDKTLVTVICKLKTIKNDISKFNFMPFFRNLSLKGAVACMYYVDQTFFLLLKGRKQIPTSQNCNL